MRQVEASHLLMRGYMNKSTKFLLASVSPVALAVWLARVLISPATTEVPPLKWSILRYGFSKEDHDGKKETYG